LDSTVAACEARAGGYTLHALSFRYGQRHAREVRAARAVGRAIGVDEHRVLTIDLAAFGGSSLTDRKLPVPKDRSERAMGRGIPSTYVPARNTIFLSFALGFAEVRRCDAIFLGANAIDYSGYPDCRPEYFEAFERMADLATKRGVEGGPKVRIETPLLRMTKADIVRRGLVLGAPLEKTWSCYLGGRRACGRCDSCRLRRKGFAEAGVPDPVPYR
ncbi:MAG: 7-cyano-7-deazaguanine synthase QueC, partial [Methanobacteriota archaeon]